MLDEIANEDIKIQKYLSLNVPVVFSTTGSPYFKKIPHLSETSDNITINYSKKNNRHLTIKSFRHHLSNTLDDIKYDDYVNKASYNSELPSGTLDYSDLEIDSEDIDEYANNEEDNYSSDDNSNENIRMPIRRYHKFMNENKNTQETSPNIPNESPESLITPENSKCTPSTKQQSNTNLLVETIEGQMDQEDINNIIEDNSTPGIEEDINNSYKEETFSENGNNNQENDEIAEEINNNNNSSHEDQPTNSEEQQNEIEEKIVTEENDEEVIEQANSKEENTLSKTISSSNSSKNIVTKTISGSKGSLEKLN